VLVVGSDPEGQLAGFDENLNSDWEDTQDEDLVEYETGAQYDGKKHKEQYATFKLFEKEWHGRTQRNGRWGYWHNENAKWDWYQTGGRWSGFLHLVDGAQGILGERSLLDRREEGPPPGTADIARKGDVDVQHMMSVKTNEASADWEAYHALVDGTSYQSWFAFHDRVKAGEITIDEARAQYKDQPQAKKIDELLGFMHVEEDEKRIAGPKDAFVLEQARSSIVTYAVLKDGEWFGRGEMGWFGMDSGRKDRVSWNDEFWAIWDSIGDDEQVTIVDCHI
jgi:hypothetical protein